MPYIDQEKLIGWHNESTNHFLCDECFSKDKGVEKEDYEAVDWELEDKDLFICDSCGARFPSY